MEAIQNKMGAKMGAHILFVHENGSFFSEKIVVQEWQDPL